MNNNAIDILNRAIQEAEEGIKSSEMRLQEARGEIEYAEKAIETWREKLEDYSRVKSVLNDAGNHP